MRPLKVVLKSSSSSGTASTSSGVSKPVESDYSSDDSLTGTSDAESSSSSDDLSIQVNSPRKLTARQRAALEAQPAAVPSVQIPVVFEESASKTIKGKKPAVLTEEEQLLESEKARKRKHLRDQKLEESKKATIERLLQKQSTRSRKSAKTIQAIDESFVDDNGVNEERAMALKAELDEKTEKYISNADGEFYITHDPIY